MTISSRGRYALRMMLYLAKNQGDSGFVALKDIAEDQDISKKYLEQIIPVLNRAGLLQTTRGFQGGYRLVNSPDQYTVGMILRATEGSLSPVACLDHPSNQCTKWDGCITRPVWEGLNRVVTEYLDSITLQDILDKNASNVGDDYVI